MIEHKDEIFSRPKRTWFITEKQKKLIANEMKMKVLSLENFLIYLLMGAITMIYPITNDSMFDI